MLSVFTLLGCEKIVMPRTIEVLPDSVANQIAAGEIVERPVSVVKELVENALDAKATRIDIDLKRGGKQRICVTDDGVGMIREDALISLDRHATSKIRTAVDLKSISTLGFRGEALPSIASVARMTIDTRGEGEDVGTRIRINGGTIVGVDESPRRRGTTVDVRNLFFNAPARSKFLKVVAAETRAVSEIVTTLALANASVGFTLKSDNRVLLDLQPAKDLTARIIAIWGREMASTLIMLISESDGMQVRGLIQRPDAAENGLRRTNLFVNGRPFRDRSLASAVDRGYRTTISSKVRPWTFVYLHMPPGSVDINVHPAKAEVRFRSLTLVESFVEKSIRECLSTEVSSATFDTQIVPPRSMSTIRKSAGPKEGSAQTAFFLSADETKESYVDAENQNEQISEVSFTEENIRLWQVLNTYVLAETRDGIIIIDQHSAHERILFEKLMKAFDEGGQTGQRLLFPLTVKLSKAEFQEAENLKGILNSVGFEVEGFGGNTIIVHAVPDPHPYFDPQRCFCDMMEELVEGSDITRSAKNQHEKIAMMFACKGAIKAGQSMNESEMQALFDQLFATELPYHDVHGRPTIVRLGKNELERKFRR